MGVISAKVLPSDVPSRLLRKEPRLVLEMFFYANFAPALRSVFAFSKRSRWILAAVFCSVLISGCPARSKATAGAPTEAEIKTTIEKSFKETYGVDYGMAKFDKVTITFPGPPQIGGLVNKQMGRGEEARPVWPVKIPVKIKVTFSNNATVRDLDRGVKSDDVFFFFKDSFGAWNFRTGSL